MVGLAWIQTRLVFFVAAAYGYDPRDPMRPAELLVLMELYDDVPRRARRSTASGKTIAESYIGSKLEREEVLAIRLAKMLGRRGIRRVAGASSRSPRSSSTRSPTSAARARSPTGRSASTAAELRPERASSVPAMLVREFVEGQEIDQVLLVRERSRGALKLGRSHRLRARHASRPSAAGCCSPGTPVRVTARAHAAASSRSAPCASPREDEYDLAELLDGPPRSATGMEADLRELLATVQDPHLRALLDAVFGPSSPTWKQFRDAPAAKRYHQAYRHGLLEHSLTVAQAVSAISATFPGIDRDVAVTGALLHDIGKLEAYTADPLAIDMTDLGKLQGEIPLGYYRIRRADRGPARASPSSSPPRSCTSSCPTTASSSTARPWSRARARPRSCT